MAARLLTTEALSAKILEWAPEVGTAVLHSRSRNPLQKHDKPVYLECMQCSRSQIASSFGCSC